MNRKPIFDAVREMLGRGFTTSEIDALDRAINVATDDAPLTVSSDGLKLIQQFEGCAKRRADGTLQAYPDPGTGGKPYTIGWGSTTDEAGNPIAPGAIWTQDRADRRFAAHVGEFAEGVRAVLAGAATTQNQFDALVSLAYNIGVRALEGSTLLRLHKAGDYAGAAGQFARWNKAGGKVLAGLTRRREAEAEMYRRQA